MAGVADALLAAIAHAPWFAALGTPLAPSERAEHTVYLAGLQLAAAVEPVHGWQAAGRVAADPDWDRRWWDAEERLRVALLARAEAAAGGGATMRQLTAIAMAAHDATIGAAAMAAAASGVADQALIRVAAGAATQACYQAGLALLAGMDAPGHAFAAKLRLFRAGRWPLGIVRGQAYIF
ncbi:MAG: hypothetical protein IT562_05140 [Alphaproteobacteria bacterium]|nr:hypothetical protein [Alphaproteobacteria bacterium]